MRGSHDRLRHEVHDEVTHVDLGVEVSVETRRLAIPEIVMVRPRVFRDDRGFFLESWNRRAFSNAIGGDEEFVQDNHSRSTLGVLRGLHYQVERPQGKLVRVVRGAIFDVAVDIRRSSARFGEWVGVELSAENQWQLWIPPGFAHGFLTVSADAELLYKTTQYYSAEHDRSIRWDDPTIGISWPTSAKQVLLSEKDSEAPGLNDAEVFD